MTATSCEVMPPLAITQPGRASSAARTTCVTAAETFAGGGQRVVAADQLAARVEQDVAVAQRLATRAPTPSGSSAVTSSSISCSALDGLDLARREADVRADDDQAVPVAAPRTSVSGAIGSIPASARTNDGPVR